METAKDWGLRPSEFFDLDADDKALMIAYTRSASRMRAWESHEQEREIKRPKRPR